MNRSYTISNDFLKASFCETGAELTGLQTKDGKQYIFRDMDVWEYSAPLLFPVCGGIKDDRFDYGGKSYTLLKHGFAMNSVFEVESMGGGRITFLLRDSEETRKSYPFSFELRVTYALSGKTLDVTYSVKNTGQEKMPFQIGAHEAYFCPGGLDEYKLVFKNRETFDSHRVSGNFICYETDRIMTDTDTLALSYDYFAVDAIIPEKFVSDSVSVVANDGSREVRVDFPGFTNLLIWANAKAKGQFVCIEPWCGGPDFVDGGHDLFKRNGIHRLDVGETFNITHSITVVR